MGLGNTVVITVISGSRLPAADSNGKSDPYVKVKLAGSKEKTKVVKKSLNPTWNESFVMDGGANWYGESVRFEVYDKDTFSKDDLLGTAHVALKDVVSGSEMEVNLGKGASLRIRIELPRGGQRAMPTGAHASGMPPHAAAGGGAPPYPTAGMPPHAGAAGGAPPYPTAGMPPHAGAAGGGAPPYPTAGMPPAVGINAGYPSGPAPTSHAPIGGAGYPTGGPEGLAPVGVPLTGPLAGSRFFQAAHNRLNRDYILIVDMSGSMRAADSLEPFGRKDTTRWNNASAAVAALADSITKFDKDGITLYLFSTNFKKFDHLTSAAQIRDLFSREQPHGTTALHLVLDAAFREHFQSYGPDARRAGRSGGTTMLVVTDGAPDDQRAVASVITRAANAITSDEDLSVSFIQIGDDHGASKFLTFLDDGLKSKFDIVDTLKDEDIHSIGFNNLVHKSLDD